MADYPICRQKTSGLSVKKLFTNSCFTLEIRYRENSLSTTPFFSFAFYGSILFDGGLSMKQLLLASANQGKLREIQALLQDIQIDLLTLKDLNLSIDVKEDGLTYAENAAKKARIFARASGMLTISDDSGLEVEALNGAPGIFSARYAPQLEATDADRRVYLLQQLTPYPPPWNARFHCTIALATRDGTVHLSEGFCQGEIISLERGSNGFGYDPIFLIPELGKTMAELDLEEKNRCSHRAQAILAIRPVLLSLL
jgi:XTP/dITP diphosphohydrolase